ncbi:MAG: hypothetical protein JXQ30_16080 [Spirochaetes bacterium]|nr:hypothetical protein [Spirochaetota bacterium]
MAKSVITTVFVLSLVCISFGTLGAAEISDCYPISSTSSGVAAITLEGSEISTIQESPHEQGFRKNLGFEASTGIQGILSFVQLGVLFPLVGESLFIDLKLKYLSSITWATYVDTEGNSVSFHPTVIGGAVSFGGYSPLLFDCIRLYGGTDLFLGYSFTPYDSWIRQTGNLIGDNVTFAVLGFFGLEFFTSPHMSIILDAGGGYKSLFGDKNNQYAVASSWLGSGFGIKMGVRYYL